jgi:UDP-N-acetylmuramate--alanine ligase
MSHLHLIGAGGIGVSAIGRYYKNLGWTVSGSDASESEITRDLQKEWVQIFIGHKRENLPVYTSLVVHTEGIFLAEKGIQHGKASSQNPELLYAQELGIHIRSYPQSLGDITNQKWQIAVAGSHGKSSTTSLLGVMLAESSIGWSTIVGTKLAQFDGTNLHLDTRSDWFAIEACEYKRHFLEYTPTIAIITNIDVDHLDYYRDEADYLSAFVSFVERTQKAVILSKEDVWCAALFEAISKEKRDALDWYWVDMNGYEHKGEHFEIPKMQLQVPGKHLLLDAHLAFVAGKIIGIRTEECVRGLMNYGGSWRRTEVIGTTIHGNIVISDYWHHPSELQPTLRAIREQYPERSLHVIFQPHQAARTRALLDEFSKSFSDATSVTIPNIYLSRDTPEDIAFMTAERFVEAISKYHSQAFVVNGLIGAEKAIQVIDSTCPGNTVILLQGAGNIDEVRYTIAYR